MNFNSLLLQAGYSQNKNSFIWKKYEYEGIKYNDGDVIEERIAKIITEANDISIFSTELAAQCTDWPSLYHLSGTRANILRPFQPQIKQANVLEIGAGCGAITRYLGECGANVLSLEGSPRRAAIARSRSRDLANVTVVADRFDQFDCDCRFDVITLIGVLEYSAMFTEGDNPTVTMLEQVRELLLPEGILIIAIENQLGLKYFAGAAEDHIGEPMLGIEGRYDHRGPHTYGRKKLSDILYLAGFSKHEFMVPFPDYKLPVSIVTEKGFLCNEFDSSAFAWQSFRRDPQLPQYLVFAPELVWQVIGQNDLTVDLANSFLIVAELNPNQKSDQNILAYHYSTSSRQAAFCKETLFTKQPDNNIVLYYNKLDLTLYYSTEEKLIEFNIPQKSNYIQGETLALKILRIVTKENWHFQELTDIFNQYLNIIKIITQKDGKPLNYESIHTNLPGSCFDLVPQNILLTSNEEWHIIDQEWTLKKDIPLGWLVFRAIQLLINSTTRFARSDTQPEYTIFKFIEILFETMNLNVTHDQIIKFYNLENEVQDYIRGYIIKSQSSWNKEIPINYCLQHQVLKNIDSNLKIAQAELSNAQAELSITHSHVLSSKAHIDNLDRIIKFHKINNLKKELELSEIRQRLKNKHQLFKSVGSVSWREDIISFCYHNKIVSKKINNFLKYFNKNSRNQLKNLKNLSKKSPLFNDNYYLSFDKKLKPCSEDLINHYYYYGTIEGRNPSPYFITEWYSNEYLDVTIAGINPLLHFLSNGCEEGRNPNPYFLVSWYLQTYFEDQKTYEDPLAHYLSNYKEGSVRPNPYFDPAWYAQTYLANELQEIEPFAHFLHQDIRANYNPNAYFDSAWYLRAYPWVEKMGMHPLQHFITYGVEERTKPNPYFDTEWYRIKYKISDYYELHPFAHYLEHLKDGNTNPNPYFDSDWYRTQYPDIIENGVDPFLHYLLHGAREGRDPGPYFKTSWYINNYPDVKESGMNPLLHFIEFGAFECRDPHPDFDTNWYLTQYPEVLETETLPLLHYIEIGKTEGKLPHDPDRILDSQINQYHAWYNKFYALTDIDRDVMRKEIAEFGYLPLLSVLMPVYNPPINFLREAIESVKNQIYTNWELCIADDASTDPAILKLLKKYSEEDSRIKVVFRSENGHISKCSNSALTLVAGEFVVLLDHDDLLSEDALFWVLETLQRSPEIDLIYSDEDKINEAGILQDPYFKPDWDPYLFLGQNYFNHLGVFRTLLIREIDGFRQGYEGAQDYDLIARCIERVEQNKIFHIPRILYHWRVLAGSTAANPDEKPYAQISAEKVIKEHLLRRGLNAEVLSNSFIGTNQEIIFRNKYSLPLVSIIIPTRNNLYLLRNCIESILNNTAYYSYEIIIVDNGSDDEETISYLYDLDLEENINVLRYDEPFNFSRLNNRAAELAQGSVLILLNNDTEVINSGWLEELVQLAILPDVGAVGAKLYYADNSIQHAGVVLGIGGCASHIYLGYPKSSYGYFGNLHLLRGYSAVTAACLAVKKSIYWEVGGLDENSLSVAYNDVDFCIKLNKYGYQNIWTPRAILFHHESISRGKEDTEEKKKRFYKEISILRKRWGDIFYNDPFYNPNLTFNDIDYAPAQLPRIALGHRHWPVVFNHSYTKKFNQKLKILIINSNTTIADQDYFTNRIRHLYNEQKILSYTIISNNKITNVSNNNSGWFDVICVNGIPYNTDWFNKNLLRFVKFLLLVNLNFQIRDEYDLDTDLEFQTLVNANKIIFINQFSFESFTLNYDLDFEFQDCLENIADDNLLMILDTLRLINPIPACCFGLEQSSSISR